VHQIYLEGLKACGINPRQHGIRFAHDDWESPKIGAWGVGGQVMLREEIEQSRDKETTSTATVHSLHS
jgi:glycyl-tRNA synthetase alpha subunit